MRPKIYLHGFKFTNTIIERFWKKVNKNGPIPTHVPHLGNCWNWIGGKQKGYGGIYPGGPKGTRQIRAHRLSYLMHVGPIENGLHALHKCDNRACVRPDHLFLGTHQDNMRDIKSKGRRPDSSGEKCSRAIFTQAQVDEIKKRLKDGNNRHGLQSEIAREFGRSPVIISQIKNGYSWKDK